MLVETASIKLALSAQPLTFRLREAVQRAFLGCFGFLLDSRLALPVLTQVDDLCHGFTLVPVPPWQYGR
jgi:hypothetical protein